MAIARLKWKSPYYVRVGDKILLRLAGDEDWVGAGEVFDIQSRLPPIRRLLGKAALPVRRGASDRVDELVTASTQPVPDLVRIHTGGCVEIESLKEMLGSGKVQQALRQGTLIRLKGGLCIDAELFREIAEKVSNYLSSRSAAATSDLKLLLGCSRKQAVLLLERMDADRLTYLKDGVRRLLRGQTPAAIDR